MDESQISIFRQNVVEVLEKTRGLRIGHIANAYGEETFPAAVKSITSHLVATGQQRETEALQTALEQCLEEKDHGGLGLSEQGPFTTSMREAAIFQVEAWLEALNSEDRAGAPLEPLNCRPSGRRPMTLSEKIFAQHAIRNVAPEGLAAGDLVRVSVDWVISSELAWAGLYSGITKAGVKAIFRNDRLWIAGDHRVDPRNYNTPLSQKLIGAAVRAEQTFKLTDYKGSNYTIMHTEFVRERAIPGSLVIGADSHTCSSGAVGALAVGLGVADVAIPVITGETWFKVPECVKMVFVGALLPGLSGKDVILHLLKRFKRNDVTANRIIEFSGPGLKQLSIDARFAISNMCTEFGAITGIFTPDEVTRRYVGGRRRQSKQSLPGLYFQPDEDAIYAETFEVDLQDVKPYVAMYPSPDNVYSVVDVVGKKLDGCFIGACTTAEEDLVLAALVLKAGLSKGMTVVPGTRHLTPGSLPIVKLLEQLDLLNVYESAGFTRGAPGCSYCVGVVDVAESGSVWLSSQNRNFPDRMGKGSIGNLASAATVAASSFSMVITDPSSLLSEIDLDTWNGYKILRTERHTRRSSKIETNNQMRIVEPNFPVQSPGSSEASSFSKKPLETAASSDKSHQNEIKSRVVLLGDFVDTDALAPSEFLTSALDDEALGEHCMEYTDPDFRGKVKAGQRVLVAGKAFGVGSSREQAPRALKGLGVRCVIAHSFAFIYARNQPNIGLLGIVINDDEFHSLAQDSVEISINLDGRYVTVREKRFGFVLDDMELALIQNGGMAAAFRRFGKKIFEKMTGEGGETRDINGVMSIALNNEAANAHAVPKELDW